MDRLIFAEQVTRAQKNPSTLMMKSEMQAMTLKGAHGLQRASPVRMTATSLDLAGHSRGLGPA